MIGTVRFALRAPLVILCLLITLLLMGICKAIGLQRCNRRLMQLSFATGARIVSLQVTVLGTLSDKRPLLLVSNHFSYLDLFAIGSKVPAAFTPKSDIATWPVVGALCKLAGCLFIDRRASRTIENKKMLERAREQGEIISLFPEGTTNEGVTLLPFRSSFFSLAEEGGITVQPLTVAYTHLNDKPADASALPIIGWYGDFEFFPHFAQFLRQKNARVTLLFHDALASNAFPSRKEMAAYCQQKVAEGYRYLQNGTAI